MKYFLPFVALFISFVIPVTTFGHGDGASFEKTVDGVLIDVGYAPESIQAQTAIRFDFAMFEEKSDTELNFADIWVRISEKTDDSRGQTYLATGVANARFGTTGMVYTFPQAGEYELAVRFQNESGDTIAETTFPISVDAAPEQDDEPIGVIPMLIGIGILGVLAGGATTVLMRRKRSAAAATDEVS